MHKLLWAVAALALSLTAAQAQEAKTVAPTQTEQAAPKKMVRDPQVRAKKMAEKISTQFNLNSGQSEQVYVLFLDQFKQIDALRDAGEAKGKARIIREQTDTKLKAILGAENFERYQQMRKEMKEKHQHHAE